MYNLAAYELEVLRKLFNITFPRLRLFFTFFVKRDRGYFCLVKRDLRFDIFVIRVCSSQDNFYEHVKAVWNYG